MATVSDLIELALKEAHVVGVGQTPLSEDVNDALRLLNYMMAQWNRKRWLIYQLVDLVVNATGAESYTVGPGGDFQMAVRPDRIEKAFFRQFGSGPTSSAMSAAVSPTGSPFVWQAPAPGVLTITGGTVSSVEFSDFSGNPTWVASSSPVAVDTGDAVKLVYSVAPDSIVFVPDATTQTMPEVPSNAVDYVLDILQSYEDYSRITIKGMTAFPGALFYDPGYPLGRAYVWPKADNRFQVHLLVKKHLEGFGSTADDIVLPPEYEAALHYNLAMRLCQHYSLPVTEELKGLARDGLEVVRGANTALARLRIPTSLRRRVRYSVLSDQFR